MAKRRGFTLAEVLLTLVVVGVVAALTIPNLIASVDNGADKVALKKPYSAISQATVQIIQDNGGSLSGLCNDANCWMQLYQAKLNEYKSCTSSVAGNCWQAYVPDPSAAYAVSAPQAGLALTDRSFVGFTHYTANCNNNVDGYPSCARIDIDINGTKGQKQDGVDVFSFHLSSTRIVPFGAGDGKPCDTFNKTGCTATSILNQSVAVPPEPPPGAVPCTPTSLCYDPELDDYVPITQYYSGWFCPAGTQCS